MNKLSISLPKIIVTVALSAILLAACSNKFAASVRKVTYPPDFKYTEKAELRTDMQSLALQMGLLDQALIKPLAQTPNEIEIQREQVLTALKNMSKIATNLQAGNSGANHPFMDDYMQKLVGKIDEARIAASFEQPRYYFAGKVSGSCVNCHKVNR
jgi:CBS-domain-containing membrane protein